MSFFDELKRRNVVRVGVAYGVAAWVLLQVADLVLENIDAPSWVIQALMLIVLLGFVAAVVIAWAYELTPDGIKKESEVDRTQSIVGTTGKKLDRIIIGFLVLAVAVLLIDRSMSPQKGSVLFSEAKNVSAETSLAISTTSPPARDSSSPDEGSIAVLPFANRSMQQEDMFFTDGIHDDLLTQLAKISDLKVISRTSMMKYRDTEKSIPEIAAELGVSTILEGGIQRAGTRIRINAQLIDVSNDQHLWAETFDREMTMENIFDIQSEITRQIVTAVKGELSTADKQSLETTPTTDLQAYEAYLRARAATLRADYSKDKYIEAQPWAERATQLDPDFAEAWALLAEIHGQAFWIGYDKSEQRKTDAQTALNKAVALKPDSAIVTAARADYQYRFENDYAQALALYKEAQLLAPGDARILLYTAITQRRFGQWKESINSFERARQLDPANIFIVTQLVDTLSLMNEWERVDVLASNWVIRYPESRDLRASQIAAKMNRNGDLELARELFDLLPAWNTNTYFRLATVLPLWERDYENMLEILDTPAIVNYTDFAANSGVKDLSRGIAHYLKGETESARSYFDRVLIKQESAKSAKAFDRAFGLAFASQAYMYIGEHEKALAASLKAMETLPVEKDRLFGSNMERNHTLILAMTGQRDEALARLARNIDGIEGYSRWELHLSPVWDFFRDDERFNELVRPLNFEESQQ